MYPDEPNEAPRTFCPVCGWECWKLWTNRNGEVVGCDNCLDEWDADEWRAENGE